MDDLISRRAATRGCYDPKMRHADYHEFAQMIDNLPSAQPEPLTEEEMRLLKKLRSFHSGSYAKLLDKLVASAQPEPHWIPCSERLPEYDGEMYLVTDYCEQINRRRIHVSYCYVNREGFWSDVPLGYKVLAWMPLPEPYKEKDNERA